MGAMLIYLKIAGFKVWTVAYVFNKFKILQFNIASERLKTIVDLLQI